MNSLKNIKFLGLMCFAALIFGACENDNGKNDNPDNDETTESSSTKADDPSVTIWELGDPDKLNPLTSTSAGARYVQNNIFSRLLEYDAKTMELAAQTAVARPAVDKIEDGEYAGGMSIAFEIHPDAKWDDGKPVIAADYIFTIKSIKNPLVNSGPLRPYYQFIHDIVVDEANPKKFTIYSKERYFLAEAAAGDVHLMPEHIYDPEGLMRKFTVKDLANKDFQTLSNDPEIKRFAEQFNNPKFDRDVVVGSGPYKFSSWETGQHIILERKEDWWGNHADNQLLKAYPSKITYKIINDQNTAVTAAKDEQLDVMRGIKPQKFVELKEDDKFQENFELSTPDQFAYYYVGINTKNEKFKDKRVRRALAHLVQRDEIIEVLFEGMAIKTNGPINPNKPYYHKDLPEIEHDIEKAKALLAEAGWTDSNQNGVVDKMIGGKKVEMKIKYKYNQGNEIRKNIGMLFKEEAKQAGIQVELEAREWTVFLEETKKRDFDLMCLAWIQGPTLDDMKQIWHSDADTRDGSNRVGFNNQEADKLIDQIRVTLDEEKRNEMYKRVQEIIYEEQPYIFLCVPSERIVIHNRFQNIETSALRPGYREAGFQLKSAAN